MAHQHNYVIQFHSRWFTLENTGQEMIRAYSTTLPSTHRAEPRKKTSW